MDYEYFSKHYKLIAIDLYKQTELENPDLKRQIKDIERLKTGEGAAMFFIIEKSEEITFEFSQNAASYLIFLTTYKNGNSKDCKFVKIVLGDGENEFSKFETRKWCVIIDQNNTDYGEGSEDNKTIKFETKVIKSSLSHINDKHVDNADNLDIIMPMYILIK